MDNNQILSAARNKVSRLLKTPEMGVGFFNDCRWMIECGETNAYYGYEVDMLLTNRTAMDYLTAAEATGTTDEITQFIRLLGRIGRANNSEDPDYIKEKWNALDEWANN